MREGKEGKRKNRIIRAAVIGGILLVVGLLVAVWLDYRRETVVLRLADYHRLNCNGRDPLQLRDEILSALVESSTFGGGLEEKIEAAYQDSLTYFVEEARSFELELDAYLQKYYGTTQESFLANLREAARETSMEDAVLDAIAKEEGLSLSAAEYEKRLPQYMESYGYTDRDKFLKNVDERKIREAMLRDMALEKVLNYLQNK